MSVLLSLLYFMQIKCHAGDVRLFCVLQLVGIDASWYLYACISAAEAQEGGAACLPSL